MLNLSNNNKSLDVSLTCVLANTNYLMVANISALLLGESGFYQISSGFILSYVTGRNLEGANQSVLSSYRCLLPADRTEILRPDSAERGKPSTLTDIIIVVIILPLSLTPA